MRPCFKKYKQNFNRSFINNLIKLLSIAANTLNPNEFILRIYLIVLLFLFPGSVLLAQTDIFSLAPKHDSVIVNNDSKQKDLADVYFKVIGRSRDTAAANKKLNAHKVNFSMIPAVGYTLQTGFAGIVSANWGFSASTLPGQKVSSINSSFTYSQYNQTIIPFVANLWTKNNKFNIITDCRYIKYPSQIFGLGSGADPNIGYNVSYSGIKVHQTVMKALSKSTFVGVGYYFDKFWDIEPNDSAADKISNLIQAKLGNSEVASGLVARYLYDTRINQIYPEQGWHVDFTYRGNFNLLGSQQEWQGIQTDIRTYFHFPKNSPNILAFWNFDWIIASKKSPQYLMLPSTGWDDQYNTGRGYIQGRFRGNNLFYLESEYRFQISNNGLFGGVVFSNVQYLPTDVSMQKNIIAPGYGGGLRIRLNKNSKANLCIDYGLGENGSKGFFVNLGEVF